MKKELLFLLLSLVILIPGLSSQEIQNSGFENWSFIQYFEEPEQYSTTNMITYFGSGEANVTKTTDAFSGSFALHLETIETEDGNMPAAAFIGEIGESAIIGGLPFSQRPDAVNGYVKFNTSNFDTAYVAVIFKRIGLPLGICWARFNGTQNTYQQFSQPVEWKLPFVNPDTIAIALISSSLFSIPEAGNTITIDQLGFEGVGSSFPGGDFENWTSVESEEADSWLSSNILTLAESGLSVTKSNDSYEGNFAAKIENKSTLYEDTLGFLTNGTIGDDGPVGGMPVSLIPEKLSGYYKYFPNGPDTALAGLTLFHYDENSGITEILEEALIKLPPTNDYTYFEVLVDYYALPKPDTVNIAFASGNIEDEFSYVGVGSTLYIDELDITYKPNIVSVNEKSVLTLPEVYPNPATDKIFFDFLRIPNQEVSMKIFNSAGKKVYDEKIGFNKIHLVEVNELERGIFFYFIISEKGQTSGKFIVE